MKHPRGDTEGERNQLLFDYPPNRSGAIEPIWYFGAAGTSVRERPRTGYPGTDKEAFVRGGRLGEERAVRTGAAKAPWASDHADAGGARG